MDAKDLRKLIAACEAQGFTVRVTSKQHRQIRDAHGQVVAVVAGTPSDHRAWRNALAHLKRAGLIWPPKQ